MDNRDMSWLRDEMRLLQEKLDEMRGHTGRIDVTLAEQAKDIAHHIKRTDALEHRVEQVATDLKPVKDHVATLRGLVWLVGFVGATLATVTAVQQMFGG